MTNSTIRTINLMEANETPKCDSKDKNHTWKVIERPDSNQSGWHVDECIVCGLRISYDTSD